MSSRATKQRSSAFPRPAKGKLVEDTAGCEVCGTRESSSFRSCPTSGARLCNSCHCKAYRLKRKLSGLAPAEGADAPELAPRVAPLRRQAQLPAAGPALMPQLMEEEEEQQQQLMPAPDGNPSQQLAPAALLPLAPACRMPEAAEPQAAAAASAAAAAGASEPQLEMVDHQRRAFEEAGGPPAEVMLTLHCARRAQSATPNCSNRVVLGVLPRLHLHLPDDPKDLLHTISCLVEAVVPAGQPGEQAADSEYHSSRAGGQRRQAPPESDEPVAVRLTVFAAAGAVACWYEAPAAPALSLGFDTQTRTPIWSSGLGGFSLHFPHPYCPQLDLFTAIHRHVASVGRAVLQQATLSLDMSGMWSSDSVGQGQAAPPVMSTPAAQAPAFSFGSPPMLLHHHSNNQLTHHQQQHVLSDRAGGGPQLSFGPIPSGPLFSTGELPAGSGLSLFDLS